MPEMIAYCRTLFQHQAALLSLGLAFAFAFQVITLRWAARSNLATALYFLATIAFIAGPLAAALVVAPRRTFSISDYEIVWTLLSFLATIIGIAFTHRNEEHHGSATSAT